MGRIRHVYLLWAEPSGVWLARSLDQGANWEPRMLLATTTGAQPYFPHLAAHGRGELAATWFEGDGEQLRWRAARTPMHKSRTAQRK